MAEQAKWQRFTLLAVLGYEGLGALAGGVLLMARPDGSAMKIPIGVLHGAFQDFLIPGVILFALGALSVAAFVAVLRRSRMDWLLAGLALGGFAIWFLVEIAIVRELVWLHAMWGLPVALGIVAAAPLLPLGPEAKRDLWLACGIASSLLYVAMNVIGSWQWPGYSSASQTVSELSAVGAPSRPLWVVLGLFYSLLAIAFGWGVATAAAGNRRLRIAGLLLVAYGALGLLAPFSPMHQREALAAGGATFTDRMHLLSATAIVLIYLAALASAAGALGKAFRAYTTLTAILLVAFAIPIFREAPHVNANQPTPLIGVWERLDIAVFLVWMIVLALALLTRAPAKAARSPLRAAGQPA